MLYEAKTPKKLEINRSLLCLLDISKKIICMTSTGSTVTQTWLFSYSDKIKDSLSF